MDDRLLLAQIDVGINRLEKSMRRAGVVVDGAAKKMAARWEKNNRKMTQSTKVSARAISSVLGGIGVGAALTLSVRTIADFRQSMSTVQAITGATADEFAALEDKARDLGATTRFSASQAAEGMIALGRAGFDTNAVLASIEGTLLLAQSGALDLGQAADIASNVLQGFQLGAEQSARAVDVLSLAANSSNTNVEQLGQALSFVAPAAAAVGVSLEDTSAAVSVLSNAGIQATRAGTGLRKIFIDLAAKGHDFSEEAGGIEGILKRLNKEFGNLGKEQRLVAASDLVGARQAASLLVLLDSVKEGTGQLATLSAAYDNAGGSAQRFAAIMDDNLNGALLATKSRLQEMAISLAEAGGEEALINALDKLQDILIFVAENADTFNKALIILTATMAGLIGAKALGGAIVMVKSFSKSLIAANVASGTATLSMRGLTAATRSFLLALGPVGLITIAAGAIAALAVNTKSAKENFEDYGDTIHDIGKANEEIIKDTASLKSLHEELAQATINGGEAAVTAKGIEINAVNERIAKNKELLSLKRSLLDEQLAAGSDNIQNLERKRSRFGASQVGLFDKDRQQFGTLGPRADAEFDALIKSGNQARDDGRVRTKAEKEAAEIQNQILEAELAFKEAQARAKKLDELLSDKGTSDSKTIDVPQIKTGESSGGKTPSLSKEAEKEKARREAAIDAIREIGKAEIEQIEELKQARFDQIAASLKANEISDKEAAALRVNVTEAAEKEIREIREKTAEDDIQAASEVRLAKADELQLIAEIAAAAARVHGRTLDATQIELDATRARYQAELDDINAVAEARAQAGLEADPQLDANRAAAQAGLAGVDADESQFRQDTLSEIDAISDGAGESDGFAAELERLQLAQAEKLAALEQFRSTDKELHAAYLAEKEQIEMEFEERRKQARLADINSQLDAAAAFTANIGKIGKDGSNAQKAAAKVQQGIALGRATVNAALAVSEAVASAPFPLNIPAIAIATATGAAQVAAISAQSFEGGGKTRSGPRSGGVDGKGGYYAVVHPDEVIADMTRPGREVAGQSIQSALNLRPNVQPPPASIPSVSLPAVASGGNNIRSGDFIVQGNVDKDNMPQLMAELAARDRVFAKNVNKVMDNRERLTTSRQDRKIGR